ncbi:MAG: hypothetical protein NTU41_07400, partial [Chloroflexi bacterium]|nr:hypothetical protein [Chloroflexota bacterium]
MIGQRWTDSTVVHCLVDHSGERGSGVRVRKLCDDIVNMLPELGIEPEFPAKRLELMKATHMEMCRQEFRDYVYATMREKDLMTYVLSGPLTTLAKFMLNAAGIYAVPTIVLQDGGTCTAGLHWSGGKQFLKVLHFTQLGEATDLLKRCLSNWPNRCSLAEVARTRAKARQVPSGSELPIGLAAIRSRIAEVSPEALYRSTGLASSYVRQLTTDERQLKAAVRDHTVWPLLYAALDLNPMGCLDSIPPSMDGMQHYTIKSIISLGYSFQEATCFVMAQPDGWFRDLGRVPLAVVINHIHRC